jgi:hypothetical protein
MKFFTDRSTYLGKFYVAVGNAELRNNMALYTTGQEVVIKTFYFSGGYFATVETQYLRWFSVRVEPSKDSTCWFIKQCEETGCACVCACALKEREQFCSSFAQVLV